MAYPVLLTLATGRSGTTYLYKLASQTFGERARVEHEALTHRQARFRRLFRCYSEEARRKALEIDEIGRFVEDVSRSSRQKPVLLFGNSLSHLAPVFASELGVRLKLLVLYRHPVHVAASAYIKSRPAWWSYIPSYESDSFGNKLTPFDPNTIFKSAGERWPGMSRFDKILYQVLEVINYSFEAPTVFNTNECLYVRSEDMFKDPEISSRIFQLAGLHAPALQYGKAPKNNTWSRSLERQPIGDAWRTFDRHPELFELNDRHLGYPLERASLERDMEKYQLPRGLMPWLRHHCRYWDMRESAARRLRSAGIIGPPRNDQGVDPDASR